MIDRLRALFTVNEQGQLIRKVNAGKAKAGQVAGNPHNAGYLRVRVDGQYILVHRVVYAVVYGELPDEVDHKDGNRTNNRPDNLRKASRAEQMRNTATMRNNKSGTKGIWYDARRSRWRGRINLHGVARVFYHKDKDAVIDWLNRTRQSLHGEFACSGR